MVGRMVSTKVVQPLLDGISTNLEVFAELIRSPIVILVVFGADDDDLEVLWEQRQGVLYLSNVSKKVANMSAILILLAADLLDLDEAVHPGNEHFLNLAKLRQASR